MTAPSSHSDARTAREHAERIRMFICDDHDLGDEETLAALDALLAQVERLEQERDRFDDEAERLGIAKEEWRRQAEAAEARVVQAERERNDLKSRVISQRKRLAELEADLRRKDEALRECNEAGSRLTSGLLAISRHLNTPYPDDPRWTPWTRFVERGLSRLEEARKQARAALAPVSPSEPVPQQAEEGR